MIGGLALVLTVVEPYRMARLTSFLNPGTDPGGAGFQAAQAKIALGSGGIFGGGSATASRRPSTCPRPTPT